MNLSMKLTIPINPSYDISKTLSKNRLVGLWRLMRGFQLHYAVSTLMQGLSALSKTATYLLLANFVDTYLRAGTQGEIPAALFALGFVGLAVAQGLATFTSGSLAAYTAEQTTRRLREYLFDHIQNLTFAYHAKNETGELLQRCTSDVDALRRFYNDQAIGIGRIILLFLVNFIAMLQLNSKLAMISVIVVPIVVTISLFFFKKVSAAYEQYQEQDAVLSTTLQENLSGVQVVKAFSRQDYEIEKFRKDNWEKFLRGKKLTLLHSLFWPITDILCGAQMLGGLLIGAIMAMNGEISVGTYMAYAGLIIWILYPLRGLGRMIVQMSNALVSYDRVFNIIKEPREPLDEGNHNPADGIKGEIIFDHVSFQYEADLQVLNDISFKVKPGMSIALLGSTGSGKTSLVNLLPRFYEYTAGNILLDGFDLRYYSRRFLRQQIGIVEQEPFLFSRSISDNLTYGVGREVTQQEIEIAAKTAAIHDVILSFPDGYRTLVGERGVTLSGGQKQRVAIARTLLINPRILILDDSTSSVDTETEADIREAMVALMRNRTTFIIAHRVTSVMDCDLILVLENGRVVQQGKHAQLLKSDGMYRQIFDIQTRIETELKKEISIAS